MLEIKELHVRYGGIHAVQGVSMRIPRGQIVTLIGANGAGKSSVIRSISGLVKDTKGEVLFTPNPRGEETPQTRQLLGRLPEDIIRYGISVSPEGRRILPHLTVEENLLLGAYIRNDKEGIAQDMEWVYSLFPRLQERSWQKGGTLSGGEQQRIVIARAVLNSPAIILADEPTGNLDSKSGGEVMVLLQNTWKKMGTKLVVITHDSRVAQMADRQFVIVDGVLSEVTAR